MILFHIRYAAENATDTRASVWLDIWGNLPNVCCPPAHF